MTTIQDLKNQITDAKLKMAKIGKTAIKDSFKELFIDFPEIAQIKISAYTPYFNDGEPCEYGVGDFVIFLTKDAKKSILGVELNEEAYEEYLEDNYCEDSYELSSSKNARGKEIVKAVRNIEKELSDQDLFMAVFGDNIMLTITTKGMEVEGYGDHE